MNPALSPELIAAVEQATENAMEKLLAHLPAILQEFGSDMLRLGLRIGSGDEFQRRLNAEIQKAKTNIGEIMSAYKGERVKLSIRISPALNEAIKSRAGLAGFPVNDWVSNLLTDYCAGELRVERIAAALRKGKRNA